MKIFTRPIAALALAALALPIFAAPVAADINPPKDAEDIAKGDEVLDEFRRMRLVGDYVLDFELEHIPRSYRRDKMYFPGRMWGTWGPDGPVVRIFFNETTQPQQQLDMLFVSGERPRVFRREVRPLANRDAFPSVGRAQEEADEAAAKVVELTPAEMFKPLFPGVSFTPFDVMMPYIYWDEYKYEGVDTTGRNTYNYIMVPPAEVKAAYPKLGGVRIEVDMQFGAMTKAELLNTKGESMKSLKVNAVKKIKEQYIANTIDYKDEESRDKSRVDVKAAAVNLKLPADVFNPMMLGRVPSVVTRDMFEEVD